MRVATICFGLLIFATPSFAQSAPCAPTSLGALTFDPYKPSDLAIVRNYGGAVLAQAPLDALLALDPYVPMEGELLRQVGRAIPSWLYPGYGWYPSAPHRSPCTTVQQALVPELATVSDPPLTTFRDMLAMLERRAPAAAARSADPASPRTEGITIEWDGRTWVTAGPAVPFSDTEFVRVGERGQSPIFRRAADANVIYMPTVPGMVAPFRAVR